MKRCRKCGENRPRSEFYVRARGTADSNCKKCAKAIAREYRIKNPTKVAAACARWRKENPERQRALARRNRLANPERERAAHARRMARYNAAHPGRNRAITAAWKKTNPARVNAACAARKAQQLRATPAWANKFFIAEAYDLAARRSALKTGGRAEWHVDHVVPLKSKLVCGLHVENNLRVIPAVVNIAKGNRHWPDMPI